MDETCVQYDQSSRSQVPGREESILVMGWVQWTGDAMDFYKRGGTAGKRTGDGWGCWIAGFGVQGG